MCLIANSFFPKKAKTDIVCYKVLVVNYNTKTEEFSLASPHIGHEYPIYPIINGKQAVMEEEMFPLLSHRKYGFRGVDRGYYHTFACESDTFRFMEYTTKYLSRGDRLPIVFRVPFECIIPKGTLYFEGGDTSSYAKVYAAKTIIINPLDDDKLNLLEKIKEYRISEKKVHSSHHSHDKHDKRHKIKKLIRKKHK